MPDLFFADLVRETSTAIGTGPLTLAGATPGHRRFAGVVPPGRRFHYSIAGVTHETQWEVGEGEVDQGALVRHQILASSSGGAAVDFLPGLKIVTLTVAARWFADRDDRQAHEHGLDQVTGLQSALEARQPAGDYAMAGHGHAALALDPGAAGSPALSFAGDGDSGLFRPEADALALATSGSERLRVTADGRVGVGITAPQGAVHIWSSSFNPFVNRSCALVLDGAFGGGLLLKDGLATGGIWTSDFGNTLILGLGSSNLAARLQVRPTAVEAGSDDSQSLGTASNRWAQLYAANGAINTSDVRDKHWIGALSAPEIAAGRALLAELGLFQWLDARAAKGADGARIHVGIRAQNAFAIVEQHGLDWRRYGWCCHDRWTDDDGVELDRHGIRPDQLALFLVAVLAQEAGLLNPAEPDHAAG